MGRARCVASKIHRRGAVLGDDVNLPRLARAGRRWKWAQRRRQARRLTAFQVFLHLTHAMRRKVPTSIIRLGDGEGALALQSPNDMMRTHFCVLCFF